MTSDSAAAKRFYTSLLGWKTEEFPFGDPANPYTMWKVGADNIGGVMNLSPDQKAMGIPPNWLPAVHVNNVDETARKATSIGGQVHLQPMDIPETGRYAVIADPQGAALAIFQANGPFGGYDGNPVLGRPSWHELMTTDYKAAFEFYRQLFGWEKIEEIDMGPQGKYFEYGMKGKMFGGMYNRPPEMAGLNPFWIPYFFVKDVKASAETAKKMGAVLQFGPMEVPGGSWVVMMGDPQKAAFAMHSTPAKPQTAAAKAVKKAAKKVAKKVKKAAKKIVKKAKSAMKKQPKAKSKARKKPAKKKGRRR